MVIDNLIKGKKAQVFGKPDKIHTYTYSPDAAKATAIPGNTPDAYNQEWLCRLFRQGKAGMPQC